MSNDNALRKDMEKSALKDLDLPRIVVEDGKILVFEENNWSEKDVRIKDEGKDEKSEKDKVEDIKIEELNQVLEKIVGEDFEVRDDEKLYDVFRSGIESYESDIYETKDTYNEEVVISERLKRIESEEEIRRGGRSMLEIVGFRDENAEKERDNKRRTSWR